MASETQVPLLWHGAPRHGAHLDIRLMSAGPEQDGGENVHEYMGSNGKRLISSEHNFANNVTNIKQQNNMVCDNFIPRIKINMQEPASLKCFFY